MALYKETDDLIGKSIAQRMEEDNTKTNHNNEVNH